MTEPAFLDREIAVAYGASRNASNFENKRIKLRTLVGKLGQCAPGPKDGPAILQGELKGTQRKATELHACHLLMFDVDAGGDFDSISSGLRAAGLFGVMWNTYSHQPDAPRIRVLLPLSEPFTFPGDGDSREHCAQRAEWSSLYTRVAERLNIPADPSCKDCSRLFYLPRRPRGSRAEDYRFEVIDGAPIDLAQFAVASTETVDLFDRMPDRGEFKTKGLRSFLAEYALTFEVVDFISARAPELIRHEYDQKGKGIDFKCPFEDVMHTTPSDTDRACFAVNASNNKTRASKAGEEREPGFFIGCAHNHCPKDRAKYLDELCQYVGISDAAELRQWLTRDDSAVVDRLARMSPLDYDRARKQAAADLAVSLQTLDREVRIRRREIANEDERPAFARDPEPWHEPVDGQTLITELVACIERYTVLPEFAAEATALWVLHSHAHEASQISPILALQSPVKRCGKTTFSIMLTDLVPRPLASSGPSAAAIYRAIEKYKPTLLLNEADTYLDENEGMRGVLNAGHNRRFARIIRVEGENMEVREFSAWGPKVISGIGVLPDTLQDRSIVIRMRRKLDNERVERLRADKAEDRLRLQSVAWRWATDNLEELRGRNPDLPSALNDRQQDNWRALLAIAEQIGGEWPRLAREAAIGLSAQAEAETAEPIEIQLLRDIKEAFDTTGVLQFKPDELLHYLWALQDSPWGNFSNNRPLTRHKLAKLLDRFQIENSQCRIDGVKSRFYVRSAFEEAFSRYLLGDSEIQIGTIGTAEELPNVINEIVGVPICGNEPYAPDKSGQQKHLQNQSVTSSVPIVPISNQESPRRERDRDADLVRRGHEIESALRGSGIGCVVRLEGLS